MMGTGEKIVIIDSFSRMAKLAFSLNLVVLFNFPGFVGSNVGVKNLYYVTQARHCIKCSPGKHFLKHCLPGNKNSTRCAPCRDGRYMPVWNTKHDCRECRKCAGLDEIIRTPCSSTSDTVCGCGHGYLHYKPNTTESKCFPYTACGKGLGVNKEGTPYKDVECAKCIIGQTFSDVESTSEKCKICTNCTSLGLNETEPCTVKSDAECDFKTTQSPGTTLSGLDTEPKKNQTPSSLPPSELEIIWELPIHIWVIIFTGFPVALLVLVICLMYCCCPDWLKARWERFQRRFLPTRACDGSSVRYSNTSDERSVCLNLSCCLRANSPEKILRPDATIDGVFDYVSYNHGAEYRSTGLALPGPFSLTTAEIDNIDEIQQGIPDKMMEILNLWREKNPVEATLDNLYKTLLSRKPKLAHEIDRLYSETQV